MDKLASIGGNADDKTTEQRIQDEIAGDDSLLTFIIQGQSEPFMKAVVSHFDFQTDLVQIRTKL